MFSLEDLELVVKKCSNKTLDRLPIELKAKFAADDLKKEQSNEEVVNAEVNVVQSGKIEAEKKNSEEVTHQALATSRAEPKLDLEKEAMKRNVAARLKEEKQKRHNEEISLKASQEKQKKHDEEIRLKAVQEKEKSHNEEIRLKAVQDAIISRESNRGKGQNQNHQQQPQNKFGNKKKNKKKQKKR